jgi:hypothetical protein
VNGSAYDVRVTWVRILGASSLSLALWAASCSDDGDNGSSSKSSSRSATNGSGGSVGGGGAGQGGCTDDLTGQAGGSLICGAQANDTECISCTRMSCCPELQGCLPDMDCHCLLQCFISGCDPVQCLADCGTSDPTSALIGCVTDNCNICTMM